MIPRATNTMRILFTKQQPLTAPGGETSHLFALANQMRWMGNEIYLMPVTDSPTPASLWPPAFTRDVPPFGLHHLFDSFSLSQAVSAFVKDTPVDAVISWQYETAWLPRRGNILAVVAAAPFGFLKKRAESSPSRRLAYHFFHFRQLLQADVIYVASKFARNELIEHLGLPTEKIVVIPIGVDDIFQPPLAPRSGKLQKFIFTGSLEPIKGIFDAIAALGIVYQQGYADWALKIAGWGDESAVRAAARQRGIESKITFTGPLERSSLAAELARADLAILPSHTETFGLSIAEAQACGLPVVSYRTGAIPEVVADGDSALLVKPFDQRQLANCISRLVDEPDFAREMGQKGQKRIRERFLWGRTVCLMLEDLQLRCRLGRKELAR